MAVKLDQRGKMKTLAFVFAGLMLATAPAFAQANNITTTTGRKDARTISVGATAEVFSAPDHATITLGAQSEAGDAASAQRTTSEITRKIIAQITKEGVEEKDIRTSTLQLFPVYQTESGPVSSRGKSPSEIIKYRASNSLTVSLSDFSKIGPIIDGAMKAGANRIEGVSFELKNDLEARLKALQKAIDEAQKKGKAIADSLELTIDGVLSVSEGENRVFPIQSAMPMMMERASFGAQTPVQPGEVRVESSVSITYQAGKVE